MPADLAALNRRFSIPGRKGSEVESPRRGNAIAAAPLGESTPDPLGALRFEAGHRGLPRAVLTAAGAEGHVYLHGAHVTHYQRDGEPPLLWLSGKSRFEHGKPIRGGVPVVFPWFGARNDAPPAGAPAALAAPGHGFARLREWEVESAARTGDGVEITLLTRSDGQTRAAWPHDFELRFRVSVGPALRMALEVRNVGGAAFTFEEALHSYFAVGDIRRASVTGLDGARYFDKAPPAPAAPGTPGTPGSPGIPGPAGAGEGRQRGPIRFVAETDRVYLGTRAACAIDDPVLGRRVAIEKSHSDATVVWNPWVAKAKAMPDFGDDEWPGMLCVETCNVGPHAVTLPPGAAHEMGATVRLID